MSRSRPPFPHITVTGGAFERGRAYGRGAQSRVRRSIALYRATFEHYAGWSWARVTRYARGFEDPVRRFGESHWEEMCGIADGAGVARDDVLAINLRTEIMFAARARAAVAGEAVSPLTECTALAVMSDRGVIVAQNWDWLMACGETVVVLEARRDGGPSFVTVVEAGLMAKLGVNDEGLALATNALVSDLDNGEPGVPYHVMLRGLLDTTSVAAAVELLRHGGRRASSANYLVGDAAGAVCDIEATPGGPEGVYVHEAQRGRVGHTNHFLAARLHCRDLAMEVAPGSPARLRRYERWSRSERSGVGIDADVRTLLRDHTGDFAICRHEDPAAPAQERMVTVASAVMHPGSRQLWVAAGNPCESPYTEIEWHNGRAGAPSRRLFNRPMDGHEPLRAGRRVR